MSGFATPVENMPTVLQYLTLHGVCCGSRPVVALANDTGYATALALKAAGADVTVIDSRPSSPRAEQARSAGLSVHCDTQVVAAHGRGRVQAVTLATGARLDTDLVAMAGGWTPTLHLYCQAGGKAVWDETRNLLVPAHAVGGVSLVGRAAGDWSPPDEGAPWTWTNAIALPASGPAKRCWIDLQNDVTLADVRLAARENLASVEHLKRYTTLGMATDQGKTSNVNGLAALADATGASMAALGTTTFRPPYVPVSFASLAGLQRGHLQSPLRRLAAERSHRRSQAFFRDYGGVLRPAWYGADGSAVGRECLAARQGAVVLDASSLGKVAVFGRAAGALLDFLFCTRMSTLAAGRCRYGLMTNEAGIVVDDGVVLCLSSEHFVVSCSSSHVGAFVASAEEWRQTRFGYSSVHVHDTTAQWATLSLSGPRSREVLATLAIVETLDDAALGHMSFCGGSFRGREARLARVSFTGERGYEISVPAGLASELWEALVAAGATPCGIEALSVLRAEKGYIYVGVDSDGETMPHDLGFDAPRGKRQDAFLGDRSLHVPAAADLHRKQLVGLQSPDKAVLAAGAHIVAADPKRRSIGFVTSSYFSPALGGGVALALVEGGRRLIGQEVQWFDQGKLGVARVVAPCRYDPQGARHHV
jgi:sarcosine oxidase subunit alpha